MGNTDSSCRLIDARDAYEKVCTGDICHDTVDNIKAVYTKRQRPQELHFSDLWISNDVATNLHSLTEAWGYFNRAFKSESTDRLFIIHFRRDTVEVGNDYHSMAIQQCGDEAMIYQSWFNTYSLGQWMHCDKNKSIAKEACSAFGNSKVLKVHQVEQFITKVLRVAFPLDWGTHESKMLFGTNINYDVTDLGMFLTVEQFSNNDVKNE
jgi:hypothetical protein